MISYLVIKYVVKGMLFAQRMNITRALTVTRSANCAPLTVHVILKPMKCSMRTGLHTPLPSRDVTVVVVLTEAHSSAAARI
ncbi:hypothetical protein TB2_007793 [Malus domestica]